MRPTYSEGVYRVLDQAQAAAGRYKHRFVHTEYLLLGLLQERNSATRLLKKLGYDRESLRRDCERRCKRGDHVMESNLKLTPRAQHILALAGEQMQAQGDKRLGTQHLLLGLLLEEEGIAGEVLRDAGVTVEAAQQALSTESRPHNPHETTIEQPRGDHRAPTPRKPFWKLLLRV